eukprot:16452391-Heterocapsa_arctica.AAC.1
MQRKVDALPGDESVFGTLVASQTCAPRLGSGRAIGLGRREDRVENPDRPAGARKHACCPAHLACESAEALDADHAARQESVDLVDELADKLGSERRGDGRVGEVDREEDADPFDVRASAPLLPVNRQSQRRDDEQ